MQYLGSTQLANFPRKAPISLVLDLKKVQELISHLNLNNESGENIEPFSTETAIGPINFASFNILLLAYLGLHRSLLPLCTLQPAWRRNMQANEIRHQLRTSSINSSAGLHAFLLTQRPLRMLFVYTQCRQNKKLNQIPCEKCALEKLE